MPKFNIPIIVTSTEYKVIEAESIEKAIEHAEIGCEQTVDYKRLACDLMRQDQANLNVEDKKTQKIRVIIQADFSPDIEYVKESFNGGEGNV